MQKVKGQVSTESLLVLGAGLLLILLIVYIVMPLLTNTIFFSKLGMWESNIGRITQGIDSCSAYGAGTGVEYRLNLPGEINVKDQYLIAETEEGKIVKPIHTKKDVEIQNNINNEGTYDVRIECEVDKVIINID